VATIWDVFQDVNKIGQKVMFYDTESGYRSVGTLEYLADRGHDVHLLTPHPHAGIEYVTVSKTGMLYRLHQKGIKVIPNTRLEAIEGSRVVAADVYTGAQTHLDEFDTIVLAMGGVAVDSLRSKLESRFDNVIAVGDCVAPRTALEAIWEGNNAGRSV
jgi:NADPH-dependent 2,4-dienoyl-CoA reductase/sulfur reductase-like enzyme